MWLHNSPSCRNCKMADRSTHRPQTGRPTTEQLRRGAATGRHSGCWHSDRRQSWLIGNYWDSVRLPIVSRSGDHAVGCDWTVRCHRSWRPPCAILGLWSVPSIGLLDTPVICRVGRRPGVIAGGTRCRVSTAIVCHIRCGRGAAGEHVILTSCRPPPGEQPIQ